MNLSKISEITAGKIRTNGVSPFSDLEISKVYPNPQQPRKKFDDIEELAYTIKEHGLLQPITVVKREDGYMIISGERRYKAHLHNKAKTIKAYIIEASEYQIKEMALIENIQRNDLTDFEKAKFISILWASGNYKTKTDLAMTIGKSSSYISKAFGCLKLDETILKDLEENINEVPLSVLEEISRIKNKDMQIDAYNKYVNKKITRNDIKNFKEPEKKVVNDFKNTKNTLTKQAKSFTKKVPRENELKTIDEIRFHTITDIKEIVSTLSKDIEIHNAYIEDNWVIMKSVTTPSYHLDNDYEKAIFKLLEENIRLKKEIKELNNKEVFIVGYREKKGTTNGGGFRCRALNENEAIEIAIKENYHNLANNKNIIWEARTLKSSCNSENMSDYISYGFGTVNDIGTYIAVCDGDFEGTITFEKGGEFVKTTHNREYQVIIKEINTPVEKAKEIKKLEKVTRSLKDEKEIALLELFGDFVTINYTNYDIDMGIDYKQAKKIIDKSKQVSIPFNVFNGTDERASRLIDEDIRTVKDNHIVLIPSS